jgi:hypothetical protein
MSSTVIAGFRCDEHGDWVAELACGHSQHMRHRPPWQNRAWTQSEEGRASKLGAPIECPLCVRPPGAALDRDRTGTGIGVATGERETTKRPLDPDPGNRTEK